MEETTLLRIALFGSAVGILILYFGSCSLEPQKLEIKEIGENETGKYVQVSGEVKRIQEYDDSILVLIENSGEIVVYSDKEFIPDNLYQGASVSASGTVKKYEGKIEIAPIRPGDVKII